MKVYIQYVGKKAITRFYHNNQYEEFYSPRKGFSLGMDARYIEQEEVDYMGNQLIEALPPSLEKGEVIDRLEHEPHYAEDERFRDDEYRIHAIARIKDFFYVFLNHLIIESKISLAIKRGYSGKYINSPQFKRNLLETSKLAKSKGNNSLDELKCISLYPSTPMEGFTIYGPSGAGKSDGIENILNKCFPQYIIHTNYKGQEMVFHQIVWLKIDCSYNGGIKGICKEFFEKIDSIIGTNHRSTFGKREKTVDDMIAGMAHVAQLHGLGLLVIDEFQHLANTKTNKEQVLNFFVTLQNKIKLPVIFIGTYKLVNEVLSLDYRQARRATGIGEVEVGYLKDKDVGELQEWDDFINALWKFQWLKNKMPLTDKLKQTLYSESIGIIDRAVKLFMVCQIEAILDGTEKITEKLIKKVAQEQMRLSENMINAIKSNNITALKKYGDLNKFDIDDFVENSYFKNKEQEDLTRIRKSQEYEINKSRKNLVNSIAMYLNGAGINENKSFDIAERVVKELGIKADITTLNRKAVQLALKENETKQEKPSKSKPRRSTSKKKTELGSEKDIYEEYKEEGKVKNPKSDFNL